jgi:arsenate reductase (glutaredoxin)
MEPWEIARERESAEAGFAGLPRDAAHRDDWIDSLAAHPRCIRVS